MRVVACEPKNARIPAGSGDGAGRVGALSAGSRCSPRARRGFHARAYDLVGEERAAPMSAVGKAVTGELTPFLTD